MNPMRAAVVLIYLFYMTAGAVVAAGSAHEDLLPLPPAQLLACLPSTPQKWTLTASAAANTFTGGWLLTYAQRGFKQVIPPPPPGAPPIAVEPKIMSVRVTDPGSKSNFATLFDPKKNAAQSKFTFLTIDNNPARKQKTGDKEIELDILLANRFLVEIKTTNMSDSDVQTAAESFDFSKLLANVGAGDTHITDPVTIVRFDELNPKNNRSYPVYW